MKSMLINQSAYQSTTQCWSLRNPALLFDFPDNHYNWDTCTYSDVVDSINCRGNFQLQSGQNKWQLGMAESLYLSDLALNPSFATGNLSGAFGLHSWGLKNKSFCIQTYLQTIKEKWRYIHWYSLIHKHLHSFSHVYKPAPNHIPLLTNNNKLFITLRPA